MAYSPARRFGRVVLGGVVAGLVGGLVIQLVLLALAAKGGHPLAPVLQGSATPFVGARATAPDFDPTLVAAGLACHYLVAVCWGVLFALLADGLSLGGTIVAGAVWGIVVWLGMAFIVLPAVGLAAMGHHMATTPLSAIEHAIFGLALGVAYVPFQRAWRTRRQPPVVRRRPPVGAPWPSSPGDEPFAP